MTKPIAPFMRIKGEPPLHLRTWTPEEFDTYLRMLTAHRKIHRQAVPRFLPGHPYYIPGKSSQ